MEALREEAMSVDIDEQKYRRRRKCHRRPNVDLMQHGGLVGDEIPSRVTRYL